MVLLIIIYYYQILQYKISEFQCNFCYMHNMLYTECRYFVPIIYIGTYQTSFYNNINKSYFKYKYMK